MTNIEYERLRAQVTKMRRTLTVLIYVYFPVVTIVTLYCGWLIFNWKLEKFRSQPVWQACVNSYEFSSMVGCGLVDESVVDARSEPTVTWYLQQMGLFALLATMEIFLSVMVIGTSRNDVARQEKRLAVETSNRRVRLAAQYLKRASFESSGTSEVSEGACA